MNSELPTPPKTKTTSASKSKAGFMTNEDTPQTLDEKLQQILDVFLLQTEALKEGMSTQSMVAGQSNVLSDLDAVTARTMSAIIAAAASQQQQPTGVLQVEIPATTTAVTGTSNKSSNGTSTATTKMLQMKYPRHVGLAELRRIRKTYLQWSANHPPEDSSSQSIAQSFVKFVEESL
jgi:Chromatin associated protein KTI12